MYHILQSYIKIQSEGVDVSREVRKALEPGVYSVLSVTSQEGLRIMNEQMDASGRALFRKMYDDYKRFGKWTGI